jgi:ankyrin repeat protein
MVEICELLLRGANPSAKNDKGDTLLHLAIENPALCAVLLGHQADPDLKNGAKKSPRDLAGPAVLAVMDEANRKQDTPQLAEPESCPRRKQCRSAEAQAKSAGEAA